MSFHQKKQSKIIVELSEELEKQPLKKIGSVPSWLNGTLIRNGPVYVTIDEKKNAHWFDGLAMLHAFSFQNGTVLYSNKFLKTDAYDTVFSNQSLNYEGFAVDPCRSLFKRFFTLFFENAEHKFPNANINVAKLANQYVALTEIPLPVCFDIKTLETIGVLNYDDNLPHNKCWESAHSHYDALKKEVVNYLIEYGVSSSYTIYKLKNSSKREIIAKIKVDEPSYMHSFAITANYVVLTEFPFKVKPLSFITKNQPFIKNFFWDPDLGTQITIVNRHNGELIGKYRTKAFFAFHHVNAFEKENTVILDVICYDNPDIITNVKDYFRSKTLSTFKERNVESRLERFTLSLKDRQVTSEIIFNYTVEFPRVNELFDGAPYQYAYMIDPSEPTSEDDSRAIYKVNVCNKESLQWSEKGCYPGEPVFVAAPNAKEEDEGVILTVVFDLVKYRSFLLVLDGKSFKEQARLNVSHPIPIGLHGRYFS